MKFPIGIDDFKEIRTSNYLFVDKTLFIKKFIDNGSKAFLITRPRRFEKRLICQWLNISLIFNPIFRGNKTRVFDFSASNTLISL